jgi:DNA-binding MarR family transcriptional regulator
MNKDKKSTLNEIYPLLLERTARQYRKFVQLSFSKKGIRLTNEQWLVLKKISEKEGISQKEIAEYAYKDPASVTRILDTLENKRYVERKITPDDRRTCALFLTEKGRRIVEKALPVASKIIEKGTDGVAYEELEEIRDILDKIFQNLK